jgi:uroporphyrinogen III methyltransferase/synthase
MARSAKLVPDRRPAILVVGRVVALRDHLRWFDVRPLFGKRVLVTRPREQAAELVRLLEAFGADVIQTPMIRIAPPDDPRPLAAACESIERFDCVVFSSTNAVDSFMTSLLASPRDIRALKGVKIAAVGPTTEERLTRFGVKADVVPTEYRAEALALAISESGDVQGSRVLLPRADIGRDVVGDELRRQGADVTEVVAYRTITADPDRDGGPDLYRMLLERQIDVVTFTSASAVRGFVQVVGSDPAPDLLGSTIVAAIGPVTAEAAAQYQIRTTIVPEHYTVPAMVQAIVDYVVDARKPQPA